MGSAFRLKTSRLMGSPWMISQISLIRECKIPIFLGDQSGIGGDAIDHPHLIGLPDLSGVGRVDKEFHSAPPRSDKNEVVGNFFLPPSIKSFDLSIDPFMGIDFKFHPPVFGAALFRLVVSNGFLLP